MPVAVYVACFVLTAVLGLCLLVGHESSRAEVRVTADEVVVRLPLPAALLGLRREVRLPRAAVRDVRVASARALTRGVRVGTGVPGWLSVGTWYHRHGRDFLDVRRGGAALCIDAGSPARFDRVLLEVADPAGAVAALRGQLAERQWP